MRWPIQLTSADQSFELSSLRACLARLVSGAPYCHGYAAGVRSDVPLMEIGKDNWREAIFVLDICCGLKIGVRSMRALLDSEARRGKSVQRIWNQSRPKVGQIWPASAMGKGGVKGRLIQRHFTQTPNAPSWTPRTDGSTLSE